MICHTMKKIIAFCLFVILCSFQPAIDTSLLTGKWKLSSHFYVDVETKKPVKEFCNLANYSIEINLFADGSYTSNLNGKAAQKGKWKVNPGNILFFFNNQPVSNAAKTGSADRGAAILQLEKDQLIIREKVCSAAIEGKSTYTRVK